MPGITSQVYNYIPVKVNVKKTISTYFRDAFKIFKSEFHLQLVLNAFNAVWNPYGENKCVG